MAPKAGIMNLLNVNDAPHSDRMAHNRSVHFLSTLILYNLADRNDICTYKRRFSGLAHGDEMECEVPLLVCSPCFSMLIRYRECLRCI